MQRDGKTLIWNEQSADLDSVTRLVERYDPWTGRAWLTLEGINWTIPVDDSYRTTRHQLRQWLITRPFRSDWGDGRFPSCPAGWPPALATATVIGVFTTSSAIVAVTGPAWVAMGILIAGAIALSRVRDAVRISRTGVQIGPAWSSTLQWSEVDAVEWRRSGRSVEVWARSERGSAAATLPAVLLPALIGRIQRLGRVPVRQAVPGSGASYERWLGPATGLPWGVLIGTAIVAPWAPSPWAPLFLGLCTSGALAALAAAVRARATGWGIGAILWLVLLYASVLALLAAAWRGLLP